MTEKKKDPSFAIETWSIDQAENALSKNEVNRNVRKDKVEQYARDLKNGKWNLYTAPIVFDSDGRLIDGQHRLTAQVKAGISTQWAVLRDVPPETQTSMDIGIARTLSDQLGLAGETHAQLLSAILKMIYMVKEHELQRSKYAISNEEILETLEKYPDARLSADIGYWFRSKRMVPLSPSVIGTAHWMIMQENGREEADAFIHRLATMTGEPEGSPVLALFRRVTEIQRQQMRVNVRDKLNLVLKAWNYDVDGKTSSRLALYSKTGEYKMIKPLKRAVHIAPQEDAEEETA